MTGFPTLLYKEVLRFWKVSFQTVAAPVLTTLLYLLVFSHALSEHVQAFPWACLTCSSSFPGLAMMAMLQNSFANSSSSLIQSKITGNIIFISCCRRRFRPRRSSPPTWAHRPWCAGLVVGLGVFAATLWMVPVPVLHPLWAIAFALVGCGLLGTLGIIAGIWSEKFDQLAAFQNFLVVPLTFLAGVFYSTHSLPPFWQLASKLNPFFYAIDGFRYGFFGQSDVPPLESFAFAAAAFAVLSWVTLTLLSRGYKLRH